MTYHSFKYKRKPWFSMQEAFNSGLNKYSCCSLGPNAAHKEGYFTLNTPVMKHSYSRVIT